VALFPFSPDRGYNAATLAEARVPNADNSPKE
jgi:hypothetical protein